MAEVPAVRDVPDSEVCEHMEAVVSGGLRPAMLLMIAREPRRRPASARQARHDLHLRRQLRVLECLVRRPRFQPADRMLSALSRILPRPALAVVPGVLHENMRQPA